MVFLQEHGDCISNANTQNSAANHVLNVSNVNVADNFLFVDAGCFAGGNTGWGLVCYDSSSSVFFSACLADSIEVEPVLAEAMGIRWSLQLALEHKLTHISLASDADVVVNCINFNCYVAAIEPIILDCKLLMAKFEFVSVKHVRRTMNVVAHDLVCLSRTVGSKLCMGYIPHQLQAAHCNNVIQFQ
jgi:ribonuclease HI